MSSASKDLEIPSTQSTPAVTADWTQGLLRLEGNSYPENSFEVLGRIRGWIARSQGEGEGPVRLDLGLVYMNTSSVKAMMDIFDLLEEAHSGSREVLVNWYYDPRNERVVEMAEEFREDYSFPFAILPRSHE